MSNNAVNFTLFSTEGCHLCEQAWQMICALSQQDRINIADIMDSPEWTQMYAIRIPVIKHPASDQTLDWPFDEQQLQQFLTQ